MVEIVDKKKILKDSEPFILWDDVDGNPPIEVFIEKKVLDELEQKPELLIDAAMGRVKDEDYGMLFIKKQGNVYG
ncbi:MAG: hypothetical protein GF311_22360 [Candidatus Lokiarchaeota archaeon]|nr:hypothetical protein [Candidatus Lokiarchaeota archaeon]